MLAVLNELKVPVLESKPGDLAFGLLLSHHREEQSEYLKRIFSGEDLSAEYEKWTILANDIGGNVQDVQTLSSLLSTIGLDPTQFFEKVGLEPTQQKKLVVINSKIHPDKSLFEEVMHILANDEPNYVKQSDRFFLEILNDFLQLMFTSSEQLESFSSGYVDWSLDEKKALQQRYIVETGFDPNTQMLLILKKLSDDLDTRKVNDERLLKGEPYLEQGIKIKVGGQDAPLFKVIYHLTNANLFALHGSFDDTAAFLAWDRFDDYVYSVLKREGFSSYITEHGRLFASWKKENQGARMSEEVVERLRDIYGDLSDHQLSEIAQLVEDDFRVLGMAVAARSLRGNQSYALQFEKGYALVSSENSNGITFFREEESGKTEEIGSITLTEEQVKQGHADFEKLRGKALAQVVARKEMPEFVQAAQETQRLLRMSENGKPVVLNVVANDLFVTGQTEGVEMVQKAKISLQKGNIFVRFIKLDRTLDEKYSDLSDAAPVGVEYGEMLLASETSVKNMTVPQGFGLLLLNREKDHIVPILPSLTTAADIKRNGKTDKVTQRLRTLSNNPLADMSEVTIGLLQQIPADFEEKKDEYLANIYKPLSIQTLKLTVQQIIGYAQMVAKTVWTSA